MLGVGLELRGVLRQRRAPDEQPDDERERRSTHQLPPGAEADGGGGAQDFDAPSWTSIFSVTGFMPSRESVTCRFPARG